MQKNIDFILKTSVVIIIFGLVFYFYFGKNGKVTEAVKDVDEVKQVENQRKIDIQNELKIQDEYNQ